jgi:hypothetical protein
MKILACVLHDSWLVARPHSLWFIFLSTRLTQASLET